MLLFQITPSLTVPTDSVFAAPPPPETLETLDILLKGGWVMVPLIVLSLLTIAIFFERVFTIRSAKSDPSRVMRDIRDYIHDGNVRGAVRYCEDQKSAICRILRPGLERLGRPITDIREAVEAAGRQEAFRLEKRTDILASVASIAPMIGFLGTVIGMIDAFRRIQQLQGNVDPGVLAGGIWEALVTTAAGLVVGIVALFGYNYLVARINRTVKDTERSATEFIDLLQTPAPSASSAAATPPSGVQDFY